ncbi:MAG: transcription antitermination factor NusB [Balneolaceae bacterium]
MHFLTNLSMINRRAVREVVLQALYALEVGENPSDEIRSFILKEKLESDKEALQFAEKLFLKTVEMKDELDETIEKQIRNWKMNRLAILDKLILRIALCEFLVFEDIPTKVTINEAIELAKQFSTRKSGRFVNGIADAALEDLLEQGKIEKRGRGLLQSPPK